jgi:inosine-uridine nucleoside N-ribohydrolase
MSSARWQTNPRRQGSIMAGSFSPEGHREFNIVNDIVNARKVFDDWPGTIIVTPFEIGLQVKFPGESIINDFAWTEYHPLRDAYKAYRKMPYDRYTWDLIAVMYAADRKEEYFTVSETGRISVDNQGYTTFEACKEGKHTYLMATPEQSEKIKDYFIGLITLRPAVFQGR